MRPRPCHGAIRCEKTVVRQVRRARRPPVQSYCSDDTGCHVGAGFGRKHIRPIWRLMVSTALCVAVLRAFPGFEVRFLHFSFLEHPVRLGIWAPVFTVLCLVGLQNAVNMADGKNGLVLALSLMWGVILFLYAPPHLQPILIIFLAAVAVALPFNLRGRLFLGDSGAYALSVLLGLLAIYVYQSGGTGPTADVVALWLLIPIVDCLRLMVVRVVNGNSPFRADVSHLHHILSRLMPWRWGVLFYLALVAVPGLLAWGFPEATLGWAVLSLLCYGTVVGLGSMNAMRWRLPSL